MTKERIIVLDERGYFRLLEFENETNSYSKVVDKVQAKDKQEAEQLFITRHKY